MSPRSLTAIASLALATSAVSALNPIAVRNNMFYNTATNERFIPVGVAYQPGGAAAVTKGKDPLSDIEQCRRDAFLFQQLGVNTIRVYSVDNEINHDECMSLLNAAGVYVILDVNSPLEGQHLNRDEPWTTYTEAYATHVFKTIQVFGGYDNCLGFFAGNELINSDVSAIASPPYVKAIIRDMKAYMREHLDRPLLVGYSAADDIAYGKEIATYMGCGGDLNGMGDFYAINSYQWCGTQTIQSSGYDGLISMFKDYNLPLFFSEYGCIEVKPRVFGEVEAIFGPEMTPSWSGGLAYEFTQEPNDYGLVEVGSDGSAKLLHDFEALSSQYAKIKNLPKTIDGNQVKAPECPAENSYKKLNGSRPLPTLSAIEALIKKGVDATEGKLGTADLTKQTKYSIIDNSGKEVSDKSIKEVKSVANSGDLRSLFPAVTGSAYGSSGSTKSSVNITGNGTTSGGSTRGNSSTDSTSQTAGASHVSLSTVGMISGIVSLIVGLSVL